ncbi:MAG TPA: ParB/RepB/Spo0J family partition protein [Candidatus Limnocylindrales bacterium]
MSRPDFRAVAARRLSEERELSPAIVSLISPEKTDRSLVRHIPVERIAPNPDQPRLMFEQSSLDELTASIREHGVLQPILIRPRPDGGFQIIAGERRWRASKAAGLATIPSLIEEMDDEAAMEIAIIENLQREDLSPLDEAIMYDRMIRDHGYSVRRLAQKLGKDKGYLENRLRLADAPDEIKQLVSLRKDTVSHAYELLKVADPRKRKRLADQVASGELSLVKLRDRIEGRRTRAVSPAGAAAEEPSPGADADAEIDDDTAPAWAPAAAVAIADDSLVLAKQRLAEAIEELGAVLRSPHVVSGIDSVDRSNLAKYLTIAKLKLENAIAVVRSGDSEG